MSAETRIWPNACAFAGNTEWSRVTNIISLAEISAWTKSRQPILKVKLPHLDGWSAARRAAADFYREEFASAGSNETDLRCRRNPIASLGLTNHHIYHQFVIRTPDRDELREHLAKREIETAIYYPLGLHEQDCFDYLGYNPGDLPETERAAGETLALPIYPEIPRDSQSFVVEAIAEFFNDSKTKLGFAGPGRSNYLRGASARVISTPKPFAATGRFRSGQTGQTVNLLALRLRWFESSPAQIPLTACNPSLRSRQSNWYVNRTVSRDRAND